MNEVRLCTFEINRNELNECSETSVKRVYWWKWKIRWEMWSSKDLIKPQESKRMFKDKVSGIN